MPWIKKRNASNFIIKLILSSWKEPARYYCKQSDPANPHIHTLDEKVCATRSICRSFRLPKHFDVSLLAVHSLMSSFFTMSTFYHVFFEFLHIYSQSLHFTKPSLYFTEYIHAGSEIHTFIYEKLSSNCFKICIKKKFSPACYSTTLLLKSMYGAFLWWLSKS